MFCAQAQAQPGTFTGTHPTSATCASEPSGENGCEYVGNITGDLYAAYAQVTDTTGIVFTWKPFTRTPPPTVNLSGTWTATLNWQNGADVSGSTTATGTCTMTGGQTGTYTAAYTVSCIGTDSNGNPASKIHYYTVHTGRFNIWEPIVEGPFSTVTFQTY